MFTMADIPGNSRESRSKGRRSSILKRQDTCILNEPQYLMAFVPLDHRFATKHPVLQDGNDGFTEGSRTPKRVSFASTATVRTIDTVPWHLINSSVSDDNSELMNTLGCADEVQDDVFVSDVSSSQPPIGSDGGSDHLGVNFQDKPVLDVLPSNDQYLPSGNVLQQDHTIYFSNLDNSDDALELTANLTGQEFYHFPNVSQSRLDRIPSFSNEQAADGEDNSIFFNLPPVVNYPPSDVRNHADDRTCFFNVDSDNGMDFTCHAVAQQNIENTFEDMEMTGNQAHFRSALVDITTHKALTPIEEMSVASNSLSQGDQENCANPPKLNFCQLRSRLVESISASAPSHEKENWPVMPANVSAVPVAEIEPAVGKDDDEISFNFRNHSLRNRQMTNAGYEIMQNSLLREDPEKISENLNFSEHDRSSGNKSLEEMAQKTAEVVNLSAVNIHDRSGGEGKTRLFSGMCMELTHCVDNPEMKNYTCSNSSVLEAKENERSNRTKLYSDVSMDYTKCVADENTRTDKAFDNPTCSSFSKDTDHRRSSEKDLDKTKCFSGETMNFTVNVAGRDMSVHGLLGAQRHDSGGVEMNVSNIPRRYEERTKHFDTSMDFTTCGRTFNQSGIKANVSCIDENQKTLTTEMNIEQTQLVTEHVNGFVSEKVLHFPNTEMEVVSFTSYNSPNISAGRRAKINVENKTNSPESYEAVQEDNFDNNLSHATSFEERNIHQKVSHLQTEEMVTFNSENMAPSDENRSSCRLKEVEDPQSSCIVLPSTENNGEGTQGDQSEDGSKRAGDSVADTCVSSDLKGNSDMERKKSLLRQRLQKDLVFSLGSRRISSAAESSFVQGRGGKYFTVESQGLRRRSLFLSQSSSQPQNPQHHGTVFSSNTEASNLLGHLERNQTTLINQSVLLNPFSPASSQCVEADISRLMEGSKTLHSSIHNEPSSSTDCQKSESPPEKAWCTNSLQSPKTSHDQQTTSVVTTGAVSPSFSGDTKNDSDDCLEDSALLVDETMPDLMPAIESFDDGKEAMIFSDLQQSCFAQEAENIKEPPSPKNISRDLKISDVYGLLGLSDIAPSLPQKSDVIQVPSSTNSLEDQLGERLFKRPQLTCLHTYVEKLEEEVRRAQKALSAAQKKFSRSPPPELLSALSGQLSEEEVSEMKSKAQTMSRTCEASARAQLNKLLAEYLLDLTSAQQNEHAALKTDLSSILSDNERVKQLQSDVDRRIRELDQLNQDQSVLHELRGQSQELNDNIASLRSQSQHLDSIIGQTHEATLQYQEKKAATEDEKALLKERLGWMGCLSEWTLLKNSPNDMSFGFLSNTVVMNVKFVNSQDPHRQITDISVESKISAGSPPLVYLVQKVMLKTLDTKSLRLEYKQFDDLSQLLSKFSDVASISRELFNELRKADLSHCVNFEECKIRLKICDRQRMSQVDIETDLAQGLYPHQPLKWTIPKILGSITSDTVQTALETVMTGEGYLLRVLEAVSSVLNKI